jgi:transcriptional regulator with XRE-family HTH domain
VKGAALQTRPRAKGKYGNYLPGLREARFEADLSQEELGRAAGLTQHTISKLELGEQRARHRTIYKLSKALGVKPEELTGEEVDEG